MMPTPLDRATDQLHRAQLRMAGEAHGYRPGGLVANEVPLQAVFFAAHEAVETDGESAFATTGPVLGLRPADLVALGAAEPAIEDEIVRPDGRIYRVRDLEPDGTGWILLRLEDLTP